MSETRPPITAGPIERAFRFLKSTSVSCGAVGEGAGVTEEESGGVVLADDHAGEALLNGGGPGGASSCADRTEIAQIEANEAKKIEERTGIAPPGDGRLTYWPSP